MALISASNVNFVQGTIGSQVPFIADDVQDLLDQMGAVETQKVYISHEIEICGFAAGGKTAALIAIDEAGLQLKDSNHWLALPCPPYCDNERETIMK